MELGSISYQFCQKVAAWVPAMFCNFVLVKKCKLSYDSTIPKAREKLSTDL
jgi:hypothetical protein